MGKSTLSFFSLARCRLQLQAEKLAGGGGQGRDSTPADRSPRRTSKPLWVPRRPNLRPSRLAPRFPRPARPWFQASVLSGIDISGLIRNQTEQLLATAVLNVPLWMPPGGPCDMRAAGCGLRIGLPQSAWAVP